MPFSVAILVEKVLAGVERGSERRASPVVQGEQADESMSDPRLGGARRASTPRAGV